MIEIRAEEARARGLRPIDIRVDLSGTALYPTKLPDSRTYVTASGPPGGPLLAIVWPTDEREGDAEGLERAIRERFEQRAQDSLEVGDRGAVPVAGRVRDALAFVTGTGLARTAWCAVIVDAGDAAAVVVAFGHGMPTGTRSCEGVLSEPNLAAFARTLVVGHASGVNIDGWIDALRARATPARAQGALLGLAVGDALGTTHEFKTLDAPAFPAFATGPLVDVIGEGPFKLVAGQVTDDTQMALALVNAVVATDVLTSAGIAKRYVAWQGVAFDVGVQITQVLDLVAAGQPAERVARDVWEQRNRFPAGNGSLMRTAVVGVLLAGVDAQTRRAATFLDSAVTHFDPRCQLACASYNAAIAHALTERASPASMLRAARAELVDAAGVLRTRHADLVEVIDAAEAALASDLDAARDDDPCLYGEELHLHRGAGFVRVAFRLAFWHLMHAPDYQSAVIDAANRGGDADTNAAIVGGLLGAFHGVDAIAAAWRERVLEAPGLRAGSLDLHPRVFVSALRRAFGGRT